MRRSIEDIIHDDDRLADYFEHEFDGELQDAAPLRALVAAADARAAAEQQVLDAVRNARTERISWGLIGAYLGTSGEAARQRYGPRIAQTS